MADKKIGKVSHYYDKIGVAVVELTGTLKVGDKIRFMKDNEEFEQTVESMQVEHQQIKEAKKGQSVGLKVEQEVKRKAEVYKVD